MTIVPRTPNEGGPIATPASFARCDEIVQSALGLAMAEGRSPRELLRTFSDELAPWLPHHHLDVTVLTTDREHFLYLGAAFREPPYHPYGENAEPSVWSGFEDGEQYDLAAFTMRHAVTDAVPLRFDDYPSDPLVLAVANPSELRTFRGGLRHGLMLPLALDGQVFGVLCFGRGEPFGPFGDDELELATSVARRTIPFVQLFQRYRFEREQRQGFERRCEVIDRLAAFARAAAGLEDEEAILRAFAAEALRPETDPLWDGASVSILDEGGGAAAVRVYELGGGGELTARGVRPLAATPERAVLLGEVPSAVVAATEQVGGSLTVPLRAGGTVKGALTLLGRGTPGADLGQFLADGLAAGLARAWQAGEAGRTAAEGDSELRVEVAGELHESILGDLVEAREALAPEAGGAAAALDRAIDHCRQLVWDLRSFAVGSDQLGALVEREAVAVGERIGAEVEIRLELGEEAIDSAQATVAHVVAKQLLANVRQHSHAHSVRVELRSEDGQLRLLVGDDGIGMPPGLIEHRAWVGDAGVGMFLVRERASIAGGRAVFRSGPGVGTEVEVRIPARHQGLSGMLRSVSLPETEPILVEPLAGESITVVVVEDHQLVREGLRRMLDRAVGFAIVGEAGDGAAGIRTATRAKPDAAIVDLKLPRRSGREVIEALAARSPATRILATSALDDERSAEQAFDAGADAFVSKAAPAGELLRVLRTICESDRDGNATAARVQVRQRSRDEQPRPQLTQRELEVLRLINTDLTYREIGAKLFLSEKTVQYHMGHVFTKFGVRSRAAAVARASELGLLESVE